jgi:hypothetical protein
MLAALSENRTRRWLCALGLMAIGCGAPAGAEGVDTESIGNSAAAVRPSLGFSRMPPGGLQPSQVPQFVSITFDDNFGLEEAGAPGGGINFINAFWGSHKNPAGTGNPATFDGTSLLTSFYYTTTYISPTDDPDGLNKKAWTAAFAAGHEAADHTVHHYNGGDVNSGTDPCCTARRWNIMQWVTEIKGAKDTLISPTAGIGAKDADVIGFRTPFLGYNDATFGALVDQRFTYDTSLPNCFDDIEDGKNCSWPYTLDSGSPDVDVLVRKFKAAAVQPHAGMWELPPTTLVVPPDSAAAQYAFTAGLRSRIPAVMPYPSLYEPATGKLAGLDYTILIDAKCTPAEMLAILKYNLDLHLGGNRAPLVFIGHSFMYSYESGNKENTPSVAVRDARWKALTDFVTYALTKPDVRIRAVKDVLGWVRAPTPLSGGAKDAGPGDAVAPPVDSGSGPSGAGGAGGGGTTGVGGSSGTGGSPSGAGGSSGTGSSGAGGSSSGAGGSTTTTGSTASGTGGSSNGGSDPGAPVAGASSGCACRIGASAASFERSSKPVREAVWLALLACFGFAFRRTRSRHRPATRPSRFPRRPARERGLPARCRRCSTR